MRRIDGFIFPPLCIVCDTPRPDNDRWLCTSCNSTLCALVINRDGCPRCSQNRAFRTCACDVAWDHPFSRIRSFVDYNDTTRSIMHQIKYQGKRGLAEYVGRLCGSHADMAEYANSIVVPIPLHWQRLWKRGYNQAEWFARGLFAGVPGITLTTGILKRVKSTRTQTKLDRSERRSNLSGAFRIAATGAATINGKRVILVDDVITTGATTAAATAVLLENGCRDVQVMSFARD